MRLVGFIIRIYRDASSPERQIRTIPYTYRLATPTRFDAGDVVLRSPPYDCSIWRAGRSNSCVVDPLRMMLALKRIGVANQ